MLKHFNRSKINSTNITHGIKQEDNHKIYNTEDLSKEVIRLMQRSVDNLANELITLTDK
ncbi:MAG: hypothetical protein OCD02_22485 [Spirochaetaceae bacterium]